MQAAIPPASNIKVPGSGTVDATGEKLPRISPPGKFTVCKFTYKVPADKPVRNSLSVVASVIKILSVRVPLTPRGSVGGVGVIVSTPPGAKKGISTGPFAPIVGAR